MPTGASLQLAGDPRRRTPLGSTVARLAVVLGWTNVLLGIAGYAFWILTFGVAVPVGVVGTFFIAGGYFSVVAGRYYLTKVRAADLSIDDGGLQLQPAQLGSPWSWDDVRYLEVFGGSGDVTGITVHRLRRPRTVTVKLADPRSAESVAADLERLRPGVLEKPD